MSDAQTPTILIVDDDNGVTEPYEEWLVDYSIRRVATGSEAIAAMDETVDVVLLDREVPATDEETLLTAIQEQERTCRVVLITPEDPGVEVLERGFDAYITKPIEATALQETVARLQNRVELAKELDSYSALVTRRSELEVEHSQGHLADHEEYQAICDRIAEHEAAVEAYTGDMSSDTEFVGTVKEIVEDDPPIDTEGGADE